MNDQGYSNPLQSIASVQGAVPAQAGAASVHSSSNLLTAQGQGEAQQSMQRLGGALHSVLSEGLQTDFPDGLKPVMHNGVLQISTYIQLTGEPEPVFIGMFPDLQAAVNAQKQSQALVGTLPAQVARKLIEAQLARTQAAMTAATGPVSAAPTITVGALSEAAAAAAAADVVRGRGLSASSDVTAVEPVCTNGASKLDGAAAELVAAQDAPTGAEPKQLDQQAAAAAPAAAAPACLSNEQPAGASTDAAPPISATEAAASAGDEPAQATPAQQPTADGGSAAAEGAPAGVAPLSALTDDVINLLLRKGLHALATTTSQPDEEAVAAGGEQQAPASAPLTVTLPPAAQLNTQLATQTLTNEDMPYTAAACVGMDAQYAQYTVPAADAVAGLAQLQQYQQQQYAAFQADPNAMPAAAGYVGQYAVVDGMLEYAAPHTQLYAAAVGLPPRPQLDAGWGSAAMPQQAAVAAAGGYVAGYAEAYAGMATGRDVYARRSSGTADAGYGAVGAAAAGGYAGDWSEYGQGYGAGSGAAGDLKRKRSDPRLNCIKSVQYRVSRFPSELHDMCVEHWERTRCARVMCNNVSGVMSVQGGRCVVSFTQHGQEVLKGVADYLRYAGEDRIKKWRRHVRMIDFPRPNRSNEFMTAEEFLCIVGYQSEQGGGKRPKYMSGAGVEGTGSD